MVKLRYSFATGRGKLDEPIHYKDLEKCLISAAQNLGWHVDTHGYLGIDSNSSAYISLRRKPRAWKELHFPLEADNEGTIQQFKIVQSTRLIVTTLYYRPLSSTVENYIRQANLELEKMFSTSQSQTSQLS